MFTKYGNVGLYEYNVDSIGEAWLWVLETPTDYMYIVTLPLTL